MFYTPYTSLMRLLNTINIINEVYHLINEYFFWVLLIYICVLQVFPQNLLYTIRVKLKARLKNIALTQLL